MMVDQGRGAAGLRIGMIISHRYRFIFLRTEKTGSTSLFRTLLGLVAESDKPYAADQHVRLRLLRERGSLEGVSFVGQGGATRRLFPRLHGLHRHARAEDVRAFVGPELFDRYTIITSERNPYDRQVSLFNHRRGNRAQADPNSFSRCMISPLYNAAPSQPPA